jgi:hypothetical protein
MGPNLREMGMVRKQECQLEPFVVLDRASKVRDVQQQGNPGEINLDEMDPKKDSHSKN